MRHALRITTFSICFCLAASVGTARQPKDGPPGPGGDSRGGKSLADSIVDRMMAFDKNNDGKLTRDEITDQRLLRMFDRADTNKDGVVTKEELIALAKKLAADETENRGAHRGEFGPPGGGPDEFGPPGGPDGGPRGRGPGGPPRPGQILPPFLQDRLKLTAEQKKQLDELQKEIDTKLATILTAEQKKQLKDMRPGPGRGGPGGRGGRGGPDDRGPGGPEGRPPGE
jgi:hypothetical protein